MLRSCTCGRMRGPSKSLAPTATPPSRSLRRPLSSIPSSSRGSRWTRGSGWSRPLPAAIGQPPRLRAVHHPHLPPGRHPTSPPPLVRSPAGWRARSSQARPQPALGMSSSCRPPGHGPRPRIGQTTSCGQRNGTARRATRVRPLLRPSDHGHGAASAGHPRAGSTSCLTTT